MGRERRSKKTFRLVLGSKPKARATPLFGKCSIVYQGERASINSFNLKIRQIESTERKRWNNGSQRDNNGRVFPDLKKMGYRNPANGIQRRRI